MHLVRTPVPSAKALGMVRTPRERVYTGPRACAQDTVGTGPLNESAIRPAFEKAAIIRAAARLQPCPGAGFVISLQRSYTALAMALSSGSCAD